jgi:hypothetical protein
LVIARARQRRGPLEFQILNFESEILNSPEEVGRPGKLAMGDRRLAIVQAQRAGGWAQLRLASFEFRVSNFQFRVSSFQFPIGQRRVATTAALNSRWPA